MDDYWEDGIIGGIVGDALGYPVHCLTRDEIAAQGLVTGMISSPHLGAPAGTWSDESSMTLATLDSIRANGKIILSDIMDRIARWVYDHEYTPFDITIDAGFGIRDAIDRFNGKPVAPRPSFSPRYDTENDSLTRIMPVCLFCYDRQKDGEHSDAEVISIIDSVSDLTQNLPRTRIACGLYYFLVREIIDHMSEDRSYFFGPFEKDHLIKRIKSGLEKGFAFYDASDRYEDEIRYYEALRDTEAFAWRPDKDIVAGRYVVQALEAAIWALITSDSYEECVLRAVNLGDAADSVAAIAGGLAGLFYGVHRIPQPWIYALQRSRWIRGFFLEPEKFIWGDETIQIEDICLRMRQDCRDNRHRDEPDLYGSEWYAYDFDAKYVKPGDATKLIDYFEGIFGEATDFRYHARKDRKGDKTEVTGFFDRDLEENGLESMNHGDILWRIRDAYLDFHVMCGEKWELCIWHNNLSYRSADDFKHCNKARYYRHDGLIKKRWTDGHFYVWSEENREWRFSASSMDDYMEWIAEFEDLPIAEIPDDISTVFYQYRDRRVKYDPLLDWYFLWEDERKEWNDGHWVQARCKEAGDKLVREWEA